MKKLLLIGFLLLSTVFVWADGQNNNCPNNQVVCGYKQCCVP